MIKPARWYHMVVIATAVMAGPASTVDAQGPAAAPVAVEVRLVGLRTVDEDDLRDLIDTRLGELLNPDTVDQDIKKLYATGWFDDIRVASEPRRAGTGVRVIFAFEERPFVSTVEFLGARKVKPRQLIAWLGVKPGDRFDPALLSAGLRRIRDRLRHEGYAFSSVGYRARRTDGQVDLVVTIDEKQKVFVEAIHFAGNKCFSEDELLSRISTRRRILGFFREVYREDRFVQDVNAIESFYRSLGFFDVQVDSAVEYDPSRRYVEQTIRINEGPRYEIRNVEVTGVEALQRADLLRSLTSRPGIPFDQRTVDADLEHLRTLYGSRGYVNARFRAERMYSKEDPLVDVVFEVQEGEQIRLGELSPRGLTFTKKEVVLREFSLKPGDLLDTSRINDAVRRLDESGYFTSVRMEKEETDRAGVEDLIVDLVEAKPAHIRFGAGFSSDRGFIGLLEHRHDNFDLFDWPERADELFKGRAFRGAGQRFSLLLQPGLEENFYQLRFEEPYFLGRPIRLAFGAHHFRRRWETYRERRSGSVLTVAKRISSSDVVDFSYRLESVNVGDLGFLTSPADAWDVKGSSMISALTFGFSRDRRNDPYLPTHGYLARASVELAGLGGDHDYIKWDLEAKWHHLLMESTKGPHVLNLRGRLGVAHGDIPLFERFYAGGAESLRGFAYREAGPHDGGDPIGGDFLLTGAAEYEFPLLRSSNVEVRGVVFTDLGWVNRSVRLTDPRLSVGAGLRFNFPGLKTLPVAVDFAWPVVRESGDETEIVNIRVGLSF